MPRSMDAAQLLIVLTDATLSPITSSCCAENKVLHVDGDAVTCFQVCRKCGVSQEASAFNKDNSKADGLRACCKACR